MRKKPLVKLQYEPDLEHYTETGSDTGAKLDVSSVDNPDVLMAYEASNELPRHQLWPYLLENARKLQDSTILLDTDMPEVVKG